MYFKIQVFKKNCWIYWRSPSIFRSLININNNNLNLYAKALQFNNHLPIHPHPCDPFNKLVFELIKISINARRAVEQWKQNWERLKTFFLLLSLAQLQLNKLNREKIKSHNRKWSLLCCTWKYNTRDAREMRSSYRAFDKYLSMFNYS